ncbi:MAG: ABC transporter permease [Dehalococcoidia bacterium]|jgi:tungstate transport system permease protein|nr:tungstate transporter permease [Chloroflexota bacterium]MDP6055696.1 ABC transporter permease [Dehalococcoidia bacterium]MDP7262795.1 ABC transporter permease [Dehalococcoidia bacterium]MDP7484821.1 ABC transporter permease [Dehalococcoidia bacterium]|tara:strand:- start:1285 stop:1983 length:699 start_codon:yes stop_codon:yes gene_type:complete
MELIWNGIVQAFKLIFHLDSELMNILWVTIRVSGTATLVSLLLGVPLGALLGTWRFPGRSAALSIIHTGMGAPPVVVGLFVMIMLWRSGPLGGLNFLYTPWAMILAQTIIAFPIITGFSMAAVAQIDPQLRQQLLGLGASRIQALRAVVQEARLPLLTAIMAGFGGAISEVGAVMMVGGNIKGETRVLTTATVLESGKGEFGTAIALSVILLLLVFGVIVGLTVLQQRNRIT